MRRLACKMVLTEQRLRYKHTALAERQHSHTASGSDTRAPSLHTCAGTDWTLMKRCCPRSTISESLAQKQEQSVSGMPEVNLNSACIAKRKREDLDNVGMPGVTLDTAHTASCTLDGVVSNPGMPDGRFYAVHLASCRGDASSKTAEMQSTTVDVDCVAKCRGRVLDEAGARPGTFETTAICSDEVVDCVEHHLSKSGMDIINDPAYMADWDQALEDAIVKASDDLMRSKGFDNACITSCKVEAMDGTMAMPAGVKNEPTHMAECGVEMLDDAQANASKDGLRCIANPSTKIKVEGADGPIPNSFNDIQASELGAPALFSDPLQHNDISWREEENEASHDDWLSYRNDIPLKFSWQQMDVLEAVACGKSVFITGSAGTGKSFLIMYIIRILRKAVGERRSVFVTASTGLAACALNGTTLHSFAGIGMGSGTPECLAGKVLRSKESRKRWRAAEVLIIDEISMIDGELFDKLDYVARIVRGNARCFGGIQLIVTGDFFQLPPVNPPNRRKFFAFEADCWNECFDLQVELEHVFRQSDSVFVKMLNEIRKGEQTPGTLQNLSMCQRVLPDDGTGIAPTRLYPLKVDVKQENMQELRALDATIVTFNSVDSAPNPLHRYMLDSMRSEKVLQLCVGAQVMLTKNIDTSCGLVNGAKGVVIGFVSRYNALVENEDEEDREELKCVAPLVSPTKLWPVVRFNCGVRTLGPKKEGAEDGGVEVVSRIQVPLILAWALSVHKCQGMTLSKVQTDLSKAFEFGMVYVALSRVKDLDGLQLMGFDPTRIKVHPNVVTFFDKLTEKL